MIAYAIAVSAGIDLSDPERTSTTVAYEEGGQFLSGYITVTALDGDWTANSEEISNFSDRVDSFFVTPEISVGF